jgi:translation initiation factor 1
MPGVNSRLVYSTSHGALCPNCRRARRECVCPKGAPGAAGEAKIRVGRETQGRSGRGVTTVSGLPLPPGEIEALATRLKKRCGSGGTVRNGVIEIQGEHRDTVLAELGKAGWSAKRSGG